MRGIAAQEIDIRTDAEAMARTDAEAISRLTAAATNATFYRDGLTVDEIAANRRIVAISVSSCAAAVANAHQHFAAAFAQGRLAGYVIATRHGADDLELDWLMVDPEHHGTGVAAMLMQKGIDWLGADKPIWLNVIRHNERAIRFYRRFGFEIDPDAATSHVVPHWIMRKSPAGAPEQVGVCLRPVADPGSAGKMVTSWQKRTCSASSTR